MGHYFEEQPSAMRDPGVVELSLGDRALALTTDTGVFSRHRVDPGTQVLLRKAPLPPEDGVVLDLGCGYGPIACALASSSPHATVWAVDVNARARELTEHNASSNGLRNLIVAAPDDVPPGLRFDAIYSNPPVRIGKDAMDELLTRWLGRLVPAADDTPPRTGRVASQGCAFLVVQRHLGSDSLQDRLRRDGWSAERLASSKGFRVLVVTRRHSHDPGAYAP